MENQVVTGTPGSVSVSMAYTHLVSKTSLCPLPTCFEFEFDVLCHCDWSSLVDVFWLYSEVSVKNAYLRLCHMYVASC